MRRAGRVAALDAVIECLERPGQLGIGQNRMASQQCLPFIVIGCGEQFCKLRPIHR